MKNKALKNAAYSDKYKEEKEHYKSLFLEKNRKESEDIILSYGYKITKNNYAGKINDRNLQGNCCTLSDNTERVIHQWKSFDDDADFEKIVTHQNGNHYLVYRQDLYGYTVFDLTNHKEFQYFPQCVLDGQEYFIWTDIHYNSLNNILAVAGCIWGAPWGILLVDFSDPMAEPKFQLDSIDCLPQGYDVYDDADFIRWDEQNLVLNCYNIEKKIKEEMIILPKVYNQKIKQLQ